MTSEAVSEKGEGNGCTHHWRIQAPSGTTSSAVCKHCGVTREFANYSDSRAYTRLGKASGKQQSG
jgi:hypothetical protein